MYFYKQGASLYLFATKLFLDVLSHTLRHSYNFIRVYWHSLHRVTFTFHIHTSSIHLDKTQDQRTYHSKTLFTLFFLSLTLYSTVFIFLMNCSVSFEPKCQNENGQLNHVNYFPNNIFLLPRAIAATSSQYVSQICNSARYNTEYTYNKYTLKVRIAHRCLYNTHVWIKNCESRVRYTGYEMGMNRNVKTGPCPAQ